MEIGTTNSSKIEANLDEINKKIEIKYIKQKKENRTYITGLDIFMTDEKERVDLIKTLKKALGASSVTKIENDKEIIGFSGNHIEKVKKYFIEKLKIPKDKITAIE